jgi:hypothetical protein
MTTEKRSTETTDRVIVRGRKVEIHSVGAIPFRVGNQHNAYEWSMIYTDRHPYPAWADLTLLRAATKDGRDYREKMLRGDAWP